MEYVLSNKYEGGKENKLKNNSYSNLIIIVALMICILEIYGLFIFKMVKR